LEQKIREYKYNVRYENSIAIGMPDYLLKIGDRGTQKMIARWRCGNEEERNRFWKRRRKDAVYMEWRKDV